MCADLGRLIESVQILNQGNVDFFILILWMEALFRILVWDPIC